MTEEKDYCEECGYELHEGEAKRCNLCCQEDE